MQQDYRHKQISQLKKMGYFFLIFATLAALITYFLPNDELIYWFSSNGKKGFYVLSSFFAFLGFYCLGAIWRRRSFI